MINLHLTKQRSQGLEIFQTRYLDKKIEKQLYKKIAHYLKRCGVEQKKHLGVATPSPRSPGAREG